MPRNQPPFDEMARRRFQSQVSKAATGVGTPVPIIGQTSVLDVFGRALQPGDKVDVRNFDGTKIPRLLFTVVGVQPNPDPKQPGTVVLQMREVLNFSLLVRGGQPTENLLLAFRPEVAEGTAEAQEPEPGAEPGMPDPGLAAVEDAQGTQAGAPDDDPQGIGDGDPRVPTGLLQP